MQKRRQIPGLERIRASDEKRRSESKKPRWYMNRFLWATVGSILTFVIMKGPTALANAARLPAAYEQTIAKFQSWRFNDSDWTGVWSSMAEGYVDANDLPTLTSTNLRVELEVSQGQVGGIISTGKICDDVPAFHYLFLDGRIKKGRIEAVVWDVVGGKHKNFATFTAVRDGTVDLIIVSKQDPMGLLPNEARIRRHPGEKPLSQSSKFIYCPGGKKSLREFLG